MTMVIIQPEEEYLMGSPVAEAERFGGPTGNNEIRHRRRIGRTFAIGAHEVTIAQFQAFRASFSDCEAESAICKLSTAVRSLVSSACNESSAALAAVS